MYMKHPRAIAMFLVRSANWHTIWELTVTLDYITVEVSFMKTSTTKTYRTNGLLANKLSILVDSTPLSAELIELSLGRGEGGFACIFWRSQSTV